MLRFLALAALLVASTPEADAQLGGVLNRARAAVTGGGSGADVDAPSPATVDGTPTPVLDYARFLNMRYWPERGMFYLGGGDDHLIFPPADLDGYADDNGRYVIRTAEGREVASQNLGTILDTRSAAFKTLGTSGAPRGVESLEDGDYVLDLEFQGRVASRIPFSISAEASGDPFDPKTIHRRSGPWSELAYFEHETDRTDYHLTFNAWVHASEIGDDNGRVRFVLKRDGSPIASSRANVDPFVQTNGDWGFASTHLVTYASREATNSTFFTIADVTPGAYTMEVQNRDTGEVIRAFDVEGASGALVPHDRSAMDYEPRHAYLTPRTIHGSSLNRMHTTYWVDVAE
ncbi:MAG: hypothetical protein AAFQ43_02040 [Bacteroidota bacterium]